MCKRIPNCTSGKDVIYVTDTLMQMEWDGWAHTSGLIHLSLVCNPEPSVVLYVSFQLLIVHYYYPVDFILLLKYVFLHFVCMTIIFALMILLATLLVTTIIII